MTLEIDPEHVAAVAARVRRHRVTVESVHDHLVAVGPRTHLTAEGTRAVAVAVDLADRLAVVVALLTRLVDRARQADRTAHELRSFAGGTVLCSAIQLASPVPARPSTTGATGVIDAGGIALDAGSLARTAATPVQLAGRSAPLVSIAATFADAVMCRLRVGSGAPISTRTTVDERGETVFEGSRSPHRYLAANGEVLDPDPVLRDRQMWRVEHSNAEGHLTEPYPGYPAYETNAPGD